MPRGRGNPRFRMKKVDERVFKMMVMILSAIIVLSCCYLLARHYLDEIKVAKRQEKIDQQLREIFVSEEEKNVTLSTKAIGYIGLVNKQEEVLEDSSVTISIVGDILCEKPLYDDAYQRDQNLFDFSSIFQNVIEYTRNTDLTIGTIETNFTEGEYSGERLYNSPKELADSLKLVGIDLLSMAHNHSLDYGIKGIQSTKQYLKKIGIDTIGARENLQESRILVKEVNGVKIAFLTYTYGINQQERKTEEELQYVNLIDKEAIVQDIQKAKEQGADYICAMMHGGDITSTQANEEQKDLVQFLLDQGVDLITGSHPAVIQPMQIRKNSDGEDAFIAYSVGNYISASEYENSNIEMILEVKITKDAKTGKTNLSKVTYTPVYLLDNGKEAENRFELYDMKDVVKKYQKGEQTVTKPIYEKILTALEDIEKLIGKE